MKGQTRFDEKLQEKVEWISTTRVLNREWG